MSAQLVLTDAQMEFIIECMGIALRPTIPPKPLPAGSEEMALRITGKFMPHLNRGCRRRPRRGR